MNKILRMTLAYAAMVSLVCGLASRVCADDKTVEIEELQKRLDALKASQTASKKDSPAVISNSEYQELLESIKEIRENQIAIQKALGGDTPRAKNPDRYPSLGLSLGLSPMDGEYTLFAGMFGEASQQGTGNQTALTIDFRLPVSDAVTLYAQGGLSSSTVKYDETYAFYGSESNWSSIFIGFGARIYFNR